MYTIIQASLTPTATINPLGGPHPTGPNSGGEAVSFHPLYGQAGFGRLFDTEQPFGEFFPGFLTSPHKEKYLMLKKIQL